jgi:hypothetical protein
MPTEEALQQLAVRFLHTHRFVQMLDDLAHLAGWHRIPSAAAVGRLSYYYPIKSY